MNDTELIAQLLHETTPEPPSDISLVGLRAAAPAPALVTIEAIHPAPSRRWLPVIAAGAVAACVAGALTAVALVGHDSHAVSPAGSGGSSPSSTSTPAASASSSGAPQRGPTNAAGPLGSPTTSYAGQPATPAAPQTGPSNGFSTSFTSGH